MHRSLTHPLSRLRARRAADAAAGGTRLGAQPGHQSAQPPGRQADQLRRPGSDQQVVCDCAEAATQSRAGSTSRHLRPVPELEAGITTAEYAVGTAAGAGLAGLLYTMLSGGFGDQLLTTLFDHVLGLLGVG